MLADFYHTKQWEKFTEQLRLSRTNEDGEIVCAECGKPIVRKYDCICHHVEQLTEENYLDANIAFNPDNIVLVHHKCHNKIHDRFQSPQMLIQQVWLVYGAPLSGKTTYVKDNMLFGDLVIDIDAIYKAISGQRMHVKPQRLTAVAFSVRDVLWDAVRMHNGYWRNAYIIGGYPMQSERERICRELGAREVFIDTTQAECITRLKAKPDGRKAEKYSQYISDWFENFS